jgi:para-aminobenzoate synthetase component 1
MEVSVQHITSKRLTSEINRPRDKIRFVHELHIPADELSARLLAISATNKVSILDSCGVSHLGAHLLVAGLEPAELVEFSSDDVDKTLGLLDHHLSADRAAMFTISYDFGLKVNGLRKRDKEVATPAEPDVFIAVFDSLVVHDYETRRTYLIGDAAKCRRDEELLRSAPISNAAKPSLPRSIASNFTKTQYLRSIDEIKDLIRSGETYQTNLTQRFEVQLDKSERPQDVFNRLRTDNPAPFAAFIRRENSTVVSASPERFIAIDGMTIRTSPIKGTRPRGSDSDEDNAFRRELLTSQKDIAENTMIVDLLRNDIGRVCEYGSVEVEKLCELEEHPTLFHLVSTVRGRLREGTKFSEVLRAIFPCGSITGAPKHRTIQIIDCIETADRGLSMGAIGISIPGPLSRLLGYYIQMSVAIRTMVIRDNVASFNVGGGIVIDSDPQKEYDESLLKAKALLNALGVRDGNSTTASGV